MMRTTKKIAKRLLSVMLTFAIIAVMCMSTEIEARAGETHSIKLKVENTEDLELPEIESNSNMYEVTNVEWSKTDDLEAGDNITAEVTVEPTDDNEIFISGKEDIKISGPAEYMSYDRIGKTFRIKIRYTVSGQLSEPDEAYWDENKPWIAKCSKVSSADEYEFVLYSGDKKVHKEKKRSNSINLAEYLAEKGTYKKDDVYFKVRALNDENDESEYVESDYFDEDDWYELWYYCDRNNIDVNGKNNSHGDSGRIVLNGWVQDISGSWSLYQNDSRLKGWQQVDGVWYYMNQNGIMLTGWQNVNGKWYFLNSNGSMATNWVYDNGKWYFCEPTNGDMIHDTWRYINNNWYYFDFSGAALKGWQFLGGAYYYLYPYEVNGHPECSMAHDTYIDGFYIDSQGRRR